MPINPGLLNAMMSRKMTFFAFLSDGVAMNRTTLTIEGVSCVLLNYGDGAFNQKQLAIQEAVTLLRKKGYALPSPLYFHLSSKVAGSQKAGTEAICRNQFGSYEGHIYLGVHATYQGPPMQVGIPEGVEHMIRDRSTDAKYATAVVVHELGHAMHDHSSPDYFWSPEANQPPSPHVEFVYRKISPYASVNKKEVVAEIWCGHNMNYFSRNNDKEIYNLYSRYQGPALR